MEGSPLSIDFIDYDALFSQYITYPEPDKNNHEFDLLDAPISLDPSNNIDPALEPFGLIEQSTFASALGPNLELSSGGTQYTSLAPSFPQKVSNFLLHDSAPSSYSRQAYQGNKRPNRNAHIPNTKFPGLGCWSLSGGKVPIRQPRSCFSDQRRKEVNEIRNLRACLRCQFLKRPCSGGDPCERCTLAADTTAKSKALTWMDCIRPSFEAVDVFEIPTSVNENALAETIAVDFFDAKPPPDLVLPFDMMTEPSFFLDVLHRPTTQKLIIGDTVPYIDFSDNSGRKIDPSLEILSKGFVHMSIYIFRSRSRFGYRRFTAADLRLARDQVASKLLREIEVRVKPSRLQSARKVELQALFFGLLYAVAAFRYRSVEMISRKEKNPFNLRSSTLPNANGRALSETKAEALERLLRHYLVKIGQSLLLITAPTDVKYLLDDRTLLWVHPPSSHVKDFIDGKLLYDRG